MGPVGSRQQIMPRNKQRAKQSRPSRCPRAPHNTLRRQNARLPLPADLLQSMRPSFRARQTPFVIGPSRIRSPEKSGSSIPDSMQICFLTIGRCVMPGPGSTGGTAMCGSWVTRDTIMNRFRSEERVIDSRLDANLLPYDWAMCHAGTWLYRRNRYVWVVGHKRHHHEPVRWVKSGRTVAFVPIHPHDVKGKPPINGKHEVFAVRNRNGISVERANFDAGHPIELLKAPPREFRKEAQPLLSRTDAPQMVARQLPHT